MNRYAYFNTLPTKTLNAVLAGWERDYDNLSSGKSGTLPFDYLIDRMNMIRVILDTRDEQAETKKHTKGNGFK